MPDRCLRLARREIVFCKPKSAPRVVVGRQRFAWINVLKQVNPAEIELFIGKEIPEFPEIDKVTNDGVGAGEYPLGSGRSRCWKLTRCKPFQDFSAVTEVGMRSGWPIAAIRAFEFFAHSPLC